MRNLSSMVKPGGILIHILPAAGYVDHGFYSFSPCFFKDYYRENGFDLLQLDLEFILSDKRWDGTRYEDCFSVYSPDLRLFKDSAAEWQRYDLNHLIHTISKLEETGHVYIWSIAKKRESGSISYPTQSMWK